jgi:hypothetical protein
MRLDQGLITLPSDVDIVTFVKNDGAIPVLSQTLPTSDARTLASLLT